MSYPVINPPPSASGETVGTCTDCIVSLPSQPTTSMRFQTIITQGQNLVLTNVGTINATYPSNNVAEQQVTIPPGEFFAINQPVLAMCVQVNAPAVVNLILPGGTAIALNVAQMIFIDEALQGFEISSPSGTSAPTVTANVFYALSA
jgi:hypothetical protein